MERTAPGLIDTVARTIGQHQYRYRDEDQLQAGIAAALNQVGIPAEREVRLGDIGRIDLLVNRLGIEVKVNGNLAALQRQIARYAHRPELDALIVVTTRATHTRLPATVADKPVRVVLLGGLR